MTSRSKSSQWYLCSSFQSSHPSLTPQWSDRRKYAWPKEELLFRWGPYCSENTLDYNVPVQFSPSVYFFYYQTITCWYRAAHSLELLRKDLLHGKLSHSTVEFHCLGIRPEQKQLSELVIKHACFWGQRNVFSGTQGKNVRERNHYINHLPLLEEDFSFPSKYGSLVIKLRWFFIVVVFVSLLCPLPNKCLNI